jgi:hypothetical protein
MSVSKGPGSIAANSAASAAAQTVDVTNGDGGRHDVAAGFARRRCELSENRP